MCNCVCVWGGCMCDVVGWGGVVVVFKCINIQNLEMIIVFENDKHLYIIPGEITFGKESYSVNEGTTTVSISVTRHGYIGSVASVGKYPNTYILESH